MQAYYFLAAEIESGLGLPDAGWINTQYWQLSLREYDKFVGKRLIGQQFSKLWHHNDSARKKNCIANME